MFDKCSALYYKTKLIYLRHKTNTISVLLKGENREW